MLRARRKPWPRRRIAHDRGLTGTWTPARLLAPRSIAATYGAGGDVVQVFGDRHALMAKLKTAGRHAHSGKHTCFEVHNKTVEHAWVAAPLVKPIK